jgi:hypothetical protein
MAPAHNSHSPGEGRHRQSSAQPVFADPSGRRQRWVKRGAATVGVFLSGYLALVVVTLSGRPNLLSIAVPGAASTKPDATRIAQPQQNSVFRSTTHNPARLPSQTSQALVPGIAQPTTADSDPETNAATSTNPPPAPTPTPPPLTNAPTSISPPPSTIAPTTSAGPTSGPPFRPSVRPPWFKPTPTEHPTIRARQSPPGKIERDPRHGHKHHKHKKHQPIDRPSDRPSHGPTNTPSDWPTDQDDQQQDEQQDSMSVPSAS